MSRRSGFASTNSSTLRAPGEVAISGMQSSTARSGADLEGHRGSARREFRRRGGWEETKCGTCGVDVWRKVGAMLAYAKYNTKPLCRDCWQKEREELKQAKINIYRRRLEIKQREK